MNVRCDRCRKRRLAAQAQEYRKRNPEKVAAARVRNSRKYYLKSNYGITPDQFAELFRVQKFRCAICRAKKPGPMDWHVDHNHDTGVVRAILCGRCNIGLGAFHDDADLLRAAARYIDLHRQLALVPRVAQSRRSQAESLAASLVGKGTSAYKGVSLCRRTGRWRAQIWVGGRHRHLGRFDTEEAAAAAYNAAAIEVWGDHARLNIV